VLNYKLIAIVGLQCYLLCILSDCLYAFYHHTDYFRFVLAAVSPAVVVPSLLSLSDKGYGTDQGIPTLVIAAASLDDVLAISAFSILLSICLSCQFPTSLLLLFHLTYPLCSAVKPVQLAAFTANHLMCSYRNICYLKSLA